MLGMTHYTQSLPYSTRFLVTYILYLLNRLYIDAGSNILPVRRYSNEIT